MRNLAGVILTIAVFAGLIALQVYLSRMESRWPGLILPILSFVLSLLIPLGMMAYSFVPAGADTYTYGDASGPPSHAAGGYGDEEPVVSGETATEVSSGTVSILVAVSILFLLGNIPTLIYLAIYFGERQKFRKRRQMERMNIQDLE